MHQWGRVATHRVTSSVKIRPSPSFYEQGGGFPESARGPRGVAPTSLPVAALKGWNKRRRRPVRGAPLCSICAAPVPRVQADTPNATSRPPGPLHAHKRNNCGNPVSSRALGEALLHLPFARPGSSLGPPVCAAQRHTPLSSPLSAMGAISESPLGQSRGIARGFSARRRRRMAPAAFSPRSCRCGRCR